MIGKPEFVEVMSNVEEVCENLEALSAVGVDVSEFVDPLFKSIELLLGDALTTVMYEELDLRCDDVDLEVDVDVEYDDDDDLYEFCLDFYDPDSGQTYEVISWEEAYDAIVDGIELVE